MLPQDSCGVWGVQGVARGYYALARDLIIPFPAILNPSGPADQGELDCDRQTGASPSVIMGGNGGALTPRNFSAGVFFARVHILSVNFRSLTTNVPPEISDSFFALAYLLLTI
jgi:hypothetical protein